MRIIGKLALTCLTGALALAGCNRDATRPASAPSVSPLHGAREAADNYLRAAASDPVSAKAKGWWSDSFAERLQMRESVFYSAKDWSISVQTVNPTQDEAIFEGTLERKVRVTGTTKAGFVEEPAKGPVSFTLRVSKQKGEGHWRVDDVQYEESSGKKP